MFNNQVTLAQTPQVDAFGRLRVSQPQTLFDSQQRFGLDRSFMSNTASGGTVSFVQGQSSANLQVVNTSGSYAARETRYVFKYQPGKSQLSLLSFVMAPQSSGNLRQQLGYYGSDNGYFLQLSDQLYICERSNISGTVTHSNVAQSSWNGDTLLGTGASGYTLDITKSQIFFIDLEWLGAGAVRTGFVLNGKFIVAHSFYHANVYPRVYMTTACLPIRYEIQALTASAPATSNLIQICCTVVSEAGYNEPMTLYSNAVSFPAGSIGTTAWSPVISARLDIASGRQDAVAQIRQIDMSLTSSDTLQWALWSNVSDINLTGANFTTPPQNGSVQIDTSSSAFNISNCWQVASGLITASGNKASSSTVLELGSYFTQLGRNSFSKTPETLIELSGNLNFYLKYEEDNSEIIVNNNQQLNLKILSQINIKWILSAIPSYINPRFNFNTIINKGLKENKTEVYYQRSSGGSKINKDIINYWNKSLFVWDSDNAPILKYFYNLISKKISSFLN